MPQPLPLRRWSPRQGSGAGSCRSFLVDELALTLDAPLIASQVAIAPHDAVAGNGERDRIGRARGSDRTDRIQGADPAGEFGVGHRGSDWDRTKLFPDAPLERRSAQIERQLKSFAGPVYE